MILARSETVHVDVLVVGGGGAGLRAAIAATRAGARVAIASDSRIGRGSLTAVSGGAFASTALEDYADAAHGWQVHFEDTVAGGRYLCEQELALEVAREMPQQIPELQEYGIDYASDAMPWLAYCIDPGHHAARMYYGAHAIGTDLTFAMAENASQRGVRFFGGVLITKLVLDDGRVVGALGVTRDGHVQPFVAGAVVLATGGTGQMLERTDNPPGATGDGYVLALEAGLPLRDMEFMQYYPTALYSGATGVYYEIVVAGVSAPLLNSRDEDIRRVHRLEDPHSLTRDNLSIAIMKEVAAGRGVEGGVQLDISGLPGETMSALTPVLPKPAQRGQRTFIVAPTAHTHLGGVPINALAETALPGLYAAGEVSGGVHGANRLGGNALTEVLVFGLIAGRQAAQFAATRSTPRMQEDIVDSERERLRALHGPDGDGVGRVRHALRETIWRNAGVLRDESSLSRALTDVEGLNRALAGERAYNGRSLQSLIKTRNLLTAAEVLCRAAIIRTESRGAHYRMDFPAEDDQHWLQTVLVRKGAHGIETSLEPVSLPYVKPVSQ